MTAGKRARIEYILLCRWGRGARARTSRGGVLPPAPPVSAFMDGNNGVIPIDTEKRVNWHKIRAEYVNGASQRSLAEKYSVPFATIQKRCRLEKWSKDREKAKIEITQKVIQKTAEKAADNATLAEDIKRKGLIMLEKLFDDFSQYLATEHRESHNNVTDIKRLRDLTAAYKDLTEDMPKVNAVDDALAAARDILGGIRSAVK